MIRVLNVISGLNNAGTEAVVMNYYRHIDRTKVQFDFLALNTDKGYYEEEILSLGGKIYKIPPLMQSPLKCLKARKKFFKTHKYDIVEVHSPSALRYAYCKLAKKYGAKKVIFHIHNYSFKCNALIKYARAQIKKYCDEVVTCSQTAAISVMGEKADKVIYNAINFDNYVFNAQKRDEIRSRYGITDSDKVIGHVGRFSEQKNPLFLLEAFAMAYDRDAALKLVMKGFGEQEEDIKNKIKQLNIEKSVILPDSTYSAAELYSAFDLFVLPSLWEGLPVVTVEAQVNGLRIVASDKITDEADISGYVLFTALDAEQWANAFLDERNYTRIPADTDLSASGYDIKKAAIKRQREYAEMIFGSENKKQI